MNKFMGIATLVLSVAANIGCQSSALVTTNPGVNKVSYLSSGERVVGNLYIPKGYTKGQKVPAIIVNPPASGVKEQTIGIYAQQLSEEGFITLAIDPRGFGESEGLAQWLNPYRIAEDIGNGIGFLRTLEEVDADNIFSLGMCAGAGYALYASAFDARVKAVAVISPFLTAGAEEQLQDLGNSANIRTKILPGVSAAAQKYYETGENTLIPLVPETEQAAKNARPIFVGMMDYYLPGKPGDVPNWRNELSLLSYGPSTSFSIYNYAYMFDGLPVYMVYGDQAVSAQGAQRMYDALGGPKEQLVLEGAGHFDLYWKPEYVGPAVKGITKFFQSQI